MKQITILGVTGEVGRKLLQKAIDKSFKVKVLIRNKSKLQNYFQNIEIIEGDYFDKDKLKVVLKDSEVILSTIGAPMNDKLFIDDDKYIDSLAYIIEQMQANKQTRWISISSAGVKMTKENLPLARKLLRVRQIASSKSSIKIKDRELQMLEQSNLDWTIIRPPMIKNLVEGEFYAHENKFIGNAVDINQLSDFMLAEISNNEWIKKAPVVGTKQ